MNQTKKYRTNKITLPLSWLRVQLSKQGQSFFVEFPDSCVLAKLDIKSSSHRGLRLFQTPKDLRNHLTHNLKIKHPHGALSVKKSIGCFIQAGKAHIDHSKSALDIIITDASISFTE